jgi:hypothetical protein
MVMCDVGRLACEGCGASPRRRSPAGCQRHLISRSITITRRVTKKLSVGRFGTSHNGRTRLLCLKTLWRSSGDGPFHYVLQALNMLTTPCLQVPATATDAPPLTNLRQPGTTTSFQLYTGKNVPARSRRSPYVSTKNPRPFLWSSIRQTRDPRKPPHASCKGSGSSFAFSEGSYYEQSVE